MTPDIPPEFRLLVAASRWPHDARSIAAVKAAADEAIDWEHFLRVATRHRVASLAYSGLKSAQVTPPPEIAKLLEAFSIRQAGHSMHLAHEAMRIRRALEEKSIEPLFVKGATLGMLAYGSMVLKQGRDIDVLVKRSEVFPTLEILRGFGYEPIHFVPSEPWQIEPWMDMTKDLEVVDRSRGMSVEIHWKLSDNNAFSRTLEKHYAAREISLGSGMSLRTLDQRIFVIYLCIHGARHAWFRLKWSADLAAIFARATPAELQDYAAFAKECRMEGCFAQAILLCDSLFELENVRSMAEHFRKSRRYRLLERIALHMMTLGKGATEVWDVRYGSVPQIFSQFIVGDDASYFWNEVRSRFVTITDVEELRLPRHLTFLYPFLHIPLAIGRRLRDRGFMQRSAPVEAKKT